MRVDELTPFRHMYDRYRLTPSVVLGKSIVTQQFTIGTTPTLIIEPTVAKFYALAVIDPAAAVLIGGKNVTISSGFPIVPATSPFSFALTENAELWAVSSGSIVIFVLDYGL